MSFMYGVKRRRRIRRNEIIVLLIAAAAAAAAIFVILSPPAVPSDGQVPAGSRNVNTRWGPLEDKDQKLLVGVRQAGLWETPSGQQAQQRGQRPRVKEIGGLIASEHIRLDEDVRNVADQLGVVLPSKPNPNQQQWMQELSGKFGDDFDRHFVHRLRAAHGKVFSLIAQVRAQSRNSLVREFAGRANQYVMRHMTYLESTGLVTDKSLH